MSNRPDWSDDPYLREQMVAAQARGELTRTAAMWTPPFLALVAGFVFFLFDKLTGPNYGATWFLVVLLAIFSVLVGYMAISAWRDIAGGTVELEGEVTRVWTRRDSLILPTHYVRVNEKILRVNKAIHLQMKVGQQVTVLVYPHSGLIAKATKLEERQEPGELAPSNG